MLPRHCNMIKAFIHVVRIALCWLIMTSLSKQLAVLQIIYITKLEKLVTDVYFTNLSNHWPQGRCDKKASIEIPRVTSQLPAAGSCVDDVKIDQHFKIIGNSDAPGSSVSEEIYFTIIIVIIPA